MSVYLVTWDLNKEGASYSAAKRKLDAQLAAFPLADDSGLDSVVFIESNATAESCYNHIAQAIDKNDTLVVTKMVRGNHQGWLSQGTWDWINQRI